ncbi:MAG: CDP-alcohol phosphatidyltransferase family protein [Vicinamibacteria bacterium]|jgi:phosphatidylglycerophosphate synthase|nr:CDP-alcohol phosphatidyltransferase family protein [Vicinamibacteria bacterium]
MSALDSNETAILALALLAALAFASMIAYALLGQRRDADADAKRAQFLGGLGDFLLHWFMWIVDPLARLAIAWRLTPLVFNYLGLAAGVLAGVTMAMGALELGAVILILSGICDILDGRIARHTKRCSDQGAFIDSVFDRYIEAAVFLGLAYFLIDIPFGSLAAAASLAGGLLVSYARARGESLGIRYTGGFMQRGERLFLIITTCLVDPSLMISLGRPVGTSLRWVLIVMAIFSLATAIHRTLWIARQLPSQPTTQPPAQT